MGETRGKAPIDLALLSSGLKAGCAPTNKKPPHSRVIQLVVTMTKDRVNEIDLLRFIAAIAVLFFHYSFRGGHAYDDLSVVSYPWITPAAKYGFPGGQLFFKISGFVIFMTASNANLKSFAISRIVRLYPTLCGMLHHYVHCNPVGRPIPRSGAAPVFILIVFICTDIHDRQQKRAHLRVVPSRPPGRANFAW